MTYCDETIGSSIKLTATENEVLAAIKPLIIARLPKLLAEDDYQRLEPDPIVDAAVLEDVFKGFRLKFLRNGANEPVAIKSIYSPYIDPEPVLELIAPYLARGSWYAITDDDSNSRIYIFDPTASNSLRSVGLNSEQSLWVVPLSEYVNGYGHKYWYDYWFPQGPPFEAEASYEVKITALVKRATECDWLFPCVAGDWE